MSGAIRGRKLHNGFIIRPKSRRACIGRNPALIEKRNLHVLYRFAWYSSDIRNSFEWTIKQLAREFYLSESTIGKIVQAGNEELLSIRKERLNIKTLNRKYPFFNWVKEPL